MTDPNLTHDLGKRQNPSTSNPTGKGLEPGAVVFYDENCPLCQDLAQLMGKLASAKVLRFEPAGIEGVQSLTVEVTDASGHITGLVGPDAWKWLLAHHPALAPLQWLAAKLGLTDPAANAVMNGADLLRRFCRRCSPRGILGR